DTIRRLAADTPAGVSRVEIKDLRYKYRDTAADVLKDVSATFNEGQKHAVIGSSGSGKTTLLGRIIEGDDQIHLYEGDRKTMTATRRRDAAIWPHHIENYNALVEDNIKLFRLMDVLPETIRNHLVSLDMAYDALETRITITSTLSGGEEQRLHFIHMMA